MIELTPKILDLIASFNDEQKTYVLKAAWAACCDGEYLQKILGDVDYDPWDGSHEEERLDIEIAQVEKVLKLKDY